MKIKGHWNKYILQKCQRLITTQSWLRNWLKCTNMHSWSMHTIFSYFAYVLLIYKNYLFKNCFMYTKLFSIKKNFMPWLVWLSELSASLWTKGSPVQFPVRPHAWVVGRVPSRGCTRGNHTLMSLSLSLPSLLSKINEIF